MDSPSESSAMTAASDPNRKEREWFAGGGRRGAPPIRPMLRGEWRPGMPCHWTEQTRFDYIKLRLLRVFEMLHICAWIAYLYFRLTQTVGIYEHDLWIYVYQYFFLCVETLGVINVFLKTCETWNICFRNCVDFKRIPSNMLEPRFSHPSSKGVRPEHANYPSIAVLIPCYNEDVRLVQDTVLGALNIEYPKELVTVYLCDDGKDSAKRDMIAHIAERYSNLRYCTRPEHTNAKAGNLNYTLERTDEDLIITLDADFVSRPNLVQRMLSYYYVWNPISGLYEFNETLASVQTPQFFRNLSPHDNDFIDQRATNFNEITLPGKDWFNASTLVGTTNLLNRKALEEAKYYPYNSVTEDTALTLVLHSLGFRTYFVNESLATGLACSTLGSHISQRERWLKGDFQILFSSKGPFTAKGLTWIQRALYFHMPFTKFLSMGYLLYDFSFLLLICFGVPIMDVPELRGFLMHLITIMCFGMCARIIRTAGGHGTDNSESASLISETVFRYNCVRGLFTVLMKGQKIKFKVTEKPRAKDQEKEAIPGLAAIYKNIEKTWANYALAAVLIVGIMKGIVRPPKIIGLEPTLMLSAVARPAGQLFQPYPRTFPMLLAVGFAMASVIPHLLAIYHCFGSYLIRYEVKDLVHGRCDQFAVDPQSGRLFVPRSLATVVTFLQFALVCGSIGLLIAF